MTEPAFVTETRIAYDTVADSYAEQSRDHLDDSPWDRAMLGTFAELVGGSGPVGDLGCGPGRPTGYLASLGLEVFGVDLSPGMVEVARRAHPGLRFEVGSLAALDLADGGLAGVLAWYSLIHTPPEELPPVVAELARVLAPGGRLLTAFQVGDERRHVAHGYGHDVSLDAYRLQPDFVAELCAAAGLVVEARLVRAPRPPEKTPQAYLLAAGRGEPRLAPRHPIGLVRYCRSHGESPLTSSGLGRPALPRPAVEKGLRPRKDVVPPARFGVAAAAAGGSRPGPRDGRATE